ncbi:MAG: hypothetical protein ACERKN_18425 [Velocimicrobium sp.]
MNSYKEPEIIVIDEAAEGIYAASGSTEDPDAGKKCASIYMQGVYSPKNGDSIHVGYKLGYGCDGCPAVANGRCTVNEITWDGDFRPWWEKQGKTGDELGW